ncbi:hypothetical protein TanjilG_10444 [Lupinus angustifolius]|uniref:Protein XRI1 n=1 Tax=Lupinus angustifolius TaxID=3871 RepID=A0A4P1R4F8_LUPAN|nr:PREDICTED: protein XRI1-like [Lupinus angustifolius]OIW01283.1 hypothetical protein TanjilG_10444 [Lupinus angustifolius]
MDFNNHKEPWDWHKEDFGFENTSDFDIPQQFWNEVAENSEDHSYMFDDVKTPVKDCRDSVYNVNSSESYQLQKEPEECRENSSQAKRRRMLQFDTKDVDHSISNEQMPLECFKLNRKEDANDDVVPEVSQWLSGASGNASASASASASSYEDLGLESTNAWLADCFKDFEMQLCPDDLNFSGADDVHIDLAGLCDLPPAFEQNVVQQRVTRTPKNIIFKGRKSFVRTPTKLASIVAYPFAFIKPSGVHGDVTLKEINQRILSPPPSKSKQSIEDSSAYPKSAFSGKPVVGKTRIRTEGGKGSITIMRTKG